MTQVSLRHHKKKAKITENKTETVEQRTSWKIVINLMKSVQWMGKV